MTKIDELIDSIPSELDEFEYSGRLISMLKLAVKQRDDWIEMFHEEPKDALDELVHANAGLEAIAKGEK